MIYWHQIIIIIKGQTGLGKSTLVNTLFASHLIDSKGRQHVQDLHKQTTQIESVSHGKHLVEWQ